MKLSKDFTLEELSFSKIAVKNGISNTPGPVEKENLRNLVVNILQPLKNKLNAPVTIASGYRSPELNSLEEGKKDSQHIKGEAVDIVVHSKPIKEVYKLLCKEFDFDQLILGHNKWIHISYRKGNNRHKSYIEKRKYGKIVFEPYKDPD